jgi:hypothetical protein
MAYVAIKGGGQAIAGASAVTEFLRTEEGLSDAEAESLARRAKRGASGRVKVPAW